MNNAGDLSWSSKLLQYRLIGFSHCGGGGVRAERANVTANVLHPGCIDTNVGKAEIPLLRNKYVEGRSEQIIPRASQISYKFVAYNNRLSSSSGNRHERREKNLQTQWGFAKTLNSKLANTIRIWRQDQDLVVVARQSTYWSGNLDFVYRSVFLAFLKLLQKHPTGMMMIYNTSSWCGSISSSTCKPSFKSLVLRFMCHAHTLCVFLPFFFFLSCRALITHFASFSCFHPKLLLEPPFHKLAILTVDSLVWPAKKSENTHWKTPPPAPSRIRQSISCQVPLKC